MANSKGVVCRTVITDKLTLFSDMDDNKSDATLNTATSISTRELQNIIERLQQERHHKSTRTNYYCVWKTFNEFIIKLDDKPKSWEKRLTLFVAYLKNKNRKSTTIRSYISAIKAVLRVQILN